MLISKQRSKLLTIYSLFTLDATWSTVNTLGATLGTITFYLIETTFNAFANRADPDQAALVSRSMKYDISVDLTSNFFVLCTNMKVCLYNYS